MWRQQKFGQVIKYTLDTHSDGIPDGIESAVVQKNLKKCDTLILEDLDMMVGRMCLAHTLLKTRIRYDGIRYDLTLKFYDQEILADFEAKIDENYTQVIAVSVERSIEIFKRAEADIEFLEKKGAIFKDRSQDIQDYADGLNHKVEEGCALRKTDEWLKFRAAIEQYRNQNYVFVTSVQRSRVENGKPFGIPADDPLMPRELNSLRPLLDGLAAILPETHASLLKREKYVAMLRSL